MNTTYFDDEIVIRHPAYLIGHTGNKLIFEDENKKLYCMVLSDGESAEMFDMGSVFDADDLLPLAPKVL